MRWTKNKGHKDDAARIKALPPREPVTEEEIQEVRSFFERGGSLFDGQVEMLIEAGREGGLFAGALVGSGKTLVTFCLPPVMGFTGRETVLFTESSLVKQVKAQYEEYAEEFHSSPPERIFGYGMLSGRKTNEVWRSLEEDPPGLVILDEAHLVGGVKSARGKRIQQYLDQHGCRVVCLTGTPFTNDVRVTCGMAAMALGEQSPLPLHFAAQRALHWFCDESASYEWSQQGPIQQRYARGLVESILGHMGVMASQAKVRTRLRAHLAKSRGVYLPDGGGASTPLTIKRLNSWGGWPSPQVKEALRRVEELWETPSGEVLVTAAQVKDTLIQLSQGFYYRQVWDGEVDYEYLAAQREWLRKARQIVNGPGGADTEMTAREAVLSGRHKQAKDALTEWMKVKDRPGPRSEAVWVDESLVRSLMANLPDNTLVWVLHLAVLDKVQELGGRVCYAGGKPELGKGPLFLTCQGFSTGHELQHFHRNFLLAYGSAAKTNEQLLGRTHRHGQLHEVEVAYFTATKVMRERFDDLLCNTLELEQKTGGQKKLTRYLTQ